jgi:uncharacterized membrane protein YgcG
MDPPLGRVNWEKMRHPSPVRTDSSQKPSPPAGSPASFRALVVAGSVLAGLLTLCLTLSLATHYTLATLIHAGLLWLTVNLITRNLDNLAATKGRSEGSPGREGGPSGGPSGERSGGRRGGRPAGSRGDGPRKPTSPAAGSGPR